MLLRYGWFMNPAIWSAKSIFNHKNQVDSSILTWNIVLKRILQSDWPKAFLTSPNQKFKNNLSCFLNLYSHATNQVDLLILSWDIAGLRILRSDWLRTLCLTTQEPEFSQIWDLCRRHRANNIYFHLTPDPEKMTDFWEKL